VAPGLLVLPGLVTAGGVAALFETVVPGIGCPPAEFVEAGEFSSVEPWLHPAIATAADNNPARSKLFLVTMTFVVFAVFIDVLSFWLRFVVLPAHVNDY
jgi:hypothetical protein